jgi:hypothetical protein
MNRNDDRLWQAIDGQRRDLRWAAGAMIGGFVGMAGLMAQGFGWL